MFNYTAGTFILTGIAIIVSLTIHEFAHALISVAYGDKTPLYYGRLTINPFAHIDFLGLISLFLLKFGWAKPVPINPNNYKNPRLGLIFTSLAGPLANILLAFFVALFYFKFQPNSYATVYFMRELILINSGLAVFNLLPFPPLDGAKIFAEIFKGKISDIVYYLEDKGIFILFLLLMFPPVKIFVSNMIQFVINGIITIALQMVSR
ncbi:Zn-dependent protease (includes SpoIVFB) [Caloramator fervidus]|uniref:Zn-dependent protease (Includes SpoIVFB) n=1 Tax=Caloramator fervidus TaxID=29344 RepID=A0A1H5UL29_9CLOT|nr:site-2 protease family protein [Caloramator fervidus]SEF75138.1 Zn-dependent protease (includes SpoIVFB) [Caloramator fervidus]